MGSTSDFGDLTFGRFGNTGVSNSTRGISLGGSTGPSTINAGINEIEYVTIQSLGDAVDFGDLIQELASIQSCNSPTRGVIRGGKEDSSNAAQNGIEYITMSTLGNASDFGDASAAHNGNNNGGGGNAVQHMVESGIEGAEFISINTDKQALDKNGATTKFTLGKQVTNGLGAGANPDIGREAALEDRDKLRDILKGTDMVFITAGMGGGTGT